MGQKGHLDLEASEMTIRAVSHRIGGRLLEKLLNADGGKYQGCRIPCGQGHRAVFVEFRNKELLTVLAPVAVRRAYYYCKICEAGVIPKDRELDIVHSSFSPGVRRMMGQMGQVGAQIPRRFYPLQFLSSRLSTARSICSCFLLRATRRPSVKPLFGSRRYTRYNPSNSLRAS